MKTHIFNENLLKTNYKFCPICKDYYTSMTCRGCSDNLANLYTLYTFRGLLNKKNIPYKLYGKLLLVFSQIQNMFPWLHLECYSYILYKIMDAIYQTKIFYFGKEFNFLWLKVMPIVISLLL